MRENQLWNTIVDTATLRDSTDEMFVSYYLLPKQMMSRFDIKNTMLCCTRRAKDKQKRLSSAEDALATCEQKLTRTANKLTAFKKRDESLQELRRELNAAQLQERELAGQLASSTNRYFIRMCA